MNISFALSLEEFKQFCCYVANKKNTPANTLFDKQIKEKHISLAELKKCAVLLPFWHDSRGDLQIILTVRSRQLKYQPGQISFPGGKFEEEDLTLINTAIRETKEEIAIPKQQIETLGILPEYLSMSGYEIYPVLGYVAPNSTWQNKSAEVDEVFCLPSRIALDIDQYQKKAINYCGSQLTIYHLLYLNYDIWGATANILYRLALSYQTYKHHELSR